MEKKSISAFLEKGNRTTWCVFLLFSFSIFLKCILFHLFCFQTLPISALFHNPLRWSVYLSKAAIAVFMASFVFITKRKHWTVVVSILLDIWIIANFIYFRANSLFITFDAMMMVNNMNGFWSSLWLYINWKIIWFPLLTLLYTGLIYVIPLSIQKHLFSYVISVVIAFSLWILTGICWCFSYQQDYRYFVPFHTAPAFEKQWDACFSYVKEHSIAAFFVYDIIDGCYSQYYRFAHSKVELTQQETEFLHYRYDRNRTTSVSTPTSNLIIVLVESLESWGLEYSQITPCLNSIIQHPHTLYVDKITSQVKHGVSGDGQMIVNTGLLPISSGAACMIYGNNVYPNFAHLYSKSHIYNPVIGIWNQTIVTNSYGYNNLTEPHNNRWEDAQTFEIFSDSLFNCSHTDNQPQLSFVITYSTHSPFDRIKLDYPELHLSEDTPDILKRYLNCLHYTDSCIGAFMNMFIQSELANNTTLVITGDHTIFKDAMLQEFVPFAQKHNLSIQNGKNYCPLIVYSPSITEPIRIEEVCYQMDIYPTILSLIGAEDYYWKGFGVNLLDSTALHNRPISEEDAYILSDKLIRSNWFRTTLDN